MEVSRQRENSIYLGSKVGLVIEGQHKMKSDQHRWTETVKVIVRVLLRNRREVHQEEVSQLLFHSCQARVTKQVGRCSREFMRLDLVIGFCGCFKAQAFSLIKENFLFQITQEQYDLGLSQINILRNWYPQYTLEVCIYIDISTHHL